MHADLLQLGSGLLCSLGADGGAVDHDAAGLELLSGTVSAKQHLVHRVVITDAKQQNIDVFWVARASAPRPELWVVFGSTASGVHL